MMKKKQKIILLLIVVSLLSTACSTKNLNASSNDLGSDNEVLKVKLAAQATSGQVFQFLSEDKGYLEEEK